MVLVYLAIVHLISIYGIIYLYSKLYLLRCIRLYGKLLIIIMIQSLQELILKCNLGDNR